MKGIKKRDPLGTKQRLTLVEQGVNGIAEMYIDLDEQMAAASDRLQQLQKEFAAQGDRMSQLEQQLQHLLQSQSELVEAVARCARKVDALALQEKADYFSRGVLDEYMYGSGKEETEWKKS